MQYQGRAEISRRKLLEISGLGFGSLALNYLLRNDPFLAAENEVKRRVGRFFTRI